MAANQNGITYYKLNSEYQGDYTKDNSLRGEEIDGNFYFLRGNDIKGVRFDNESIIIEKYNGDEIKADKVKEITISNISYDTENGILSIIKNDGKTENLSGFTTSNTIYHDSTLNGNGSNINPLKISNINKTGRYLPVKKVIDFSLGDKLPDVNNYHDRYISIENTNGFGRLYNKTEMININNSLLSTDDNGWHVPSKEEWDTIIENIKETLDIPSGSALKSINYWEPYNGEVLSKDIYGFSVYPLGYSIEKDDDTYVGSKKFAYFWTSTLNEDDEYFSKRFTYKNEYVKEESFGDENYFNIRLVKKFNGNNFNEIENIHGKTFTCIHIPGTSLIWTKENICFPEYGGFIPYEWDTFKEIEKKFYINDWNGVQWDKIKLGEGESVIIHDHENQTNHEWMIMNNELIDYTSLLVDDNQKIEISENGNLKLDNNGIYFDGNFGTF